ncbi:hypothetical protein H4R35_002225 [Dimargaris xerosporica]|nr:hypothetical protein H4R35_002225 [Dimargaris xerosporica]
MHLFIVGLLGVALGASPLALVSAIPTQAYTSDTDQSRGPSTLDQHKDASRFAVDSIRPAMPSFTNLQSFGEEDVFETIPLDDELALGYDSDHENGKLSNGGEESSSDGGWGPGTLLATMSSLEPTSLGPVAPCQPSLYSPVHRHLMESGISRKICNLLTKQLDKPLLREEEDLLEWYMQKHASKVFQLIASDVTQFYGLSRPLRPHYETSLTRYDTALNHPVLLGLALHADKDYATTYMVKLTQMHKNFIDQAVYLESTPDRWAPMTADFVSTLVLHHQIPAAIEYLNHMQGLGMDTDELLVTRAYWLYLDQAYDHARTLLGEVSCDELGEHPDIEALCIPLKVLLDQQHKNPGTAEGVLRQLDGAATDLTPVGLGFGPHLTQLPANREGLIFVSVPRIN